MCDGPAEARALCRRLLDDAGEAVALSARQEVLRRIYRPEPWDGVPRELVLSVARAAAYDRSHRDPVVDRPPPAGLGTGLVRLPRWIAGLGRRSWARLRGS